MNLLYCGDANVCDGIFMSALSVEKHAGEAVAFYILTAGVGEREAIPPEFADRLRKGFEQFGSDSQVFIFDLSDAFLKEEPTSNMQTRFTPFCMLRLFADEVDEIPDRILYLDADVLCRAGFGEMYHSDISDIEIAGVPDRYGKWFFGDRLRHDYLNSGVLLMNMDRIRSSGLLARCRQMCRTTEMFMPDQTALNKLAVKRKIPQRYNNQGRIKSNTVFKHFTTYFRIFPYVKAITIKPWQPELMHRKLGVYEFDYLLEQLVRSKDNEL